MIILKLPIWLKGEFYSNLLRAAQAWYAKLEYWIAWPLRQLDVATCEEYLLDVYAYQRGITKIIGEPISLYRLRIKTAFINSEEAGTITGLKNIMRRLEVPVVSVKHKISGRHWAVVEVEVTQSVNSEYGDILQEIFSTYGKLCRTYEVKVLTPLSVNFRVGVSFSTSTTIVAR